jgi:hypothetical protein
MWKLDREAHSVTSAFAGILNSSDVCRRGTEVTCSFRTQPASYVWGRVAWTPPDCRTVGSRGWNSPASSALAVHAGATGSTDVGTEGPEASSVFIHPVFHCFGLGRVFCLLGSNIPGLLAIFVSFVSCTIDWLLLHKKGFINWPIFSGEQTWHFYFVQWDFVY